MKGTSVPSNSLYDHQCTARCGGNEHVDLGYWSAEAWTTSEVGSRWQAAYRRSGVDIEVLTIEPAGEAPERPDLDGEAWLVRWCLTS